MELLERSFVLCKQGVAGSIPATSTNTFILNQLQSLFFLLGGAVVKT
jgi:hypothetical protein